MTKLQIVIETENSLKENNIQKYYVCDMGTPLYISSDLTIFFNSFDDIVSISLIKGYTVELTFLKCGYYINVIPEVI